MSFAWRCLVVDSTIVVLRESILAVCCTLVVLGPALELLVLVPYLLAGRLLRVRPSPGVVRISGLDPWPMCIIGSALIILVPVVLTVTRVSASFVIAPAVALLFGSRLSVRIDAKGTRVVRTFAYVVPWYWRTRPVRPMAYADGWGDLSDPDSLRLFVDEDEDIELAWGDGGLHCEELAAAINAAMTTIEEPKPLGVRGPFDRRVV